MKENPEFAIEIPLEKTITKDGTTIVDSLVLATSDEAHKKLHELKAEQGEELISGERIESYAKLEEIAQKVSERSSFGFTNWNCSWNPKGPKPNWVVPENPSNN